MTPNAADHVLEDAIQRPSQRMIATSTAKHEGQPTLSSVHLNAPVWREESE